MWRAGNTGRKNNAKNRHLSTIAQLCRAVSEVKVTELLNFPKLAKPCMLAAMTVSPLPGLSG